MERLPLDRTTTEKMLSGALRPDQAPPGYARVAAILSAAAWPALDGDSALRERTLSAMARAVQETASAAPPKDRTVRAHDKTRRRFLKTKLVAAMAAALLVMGSGLAFAGALPAPMQNAASQVLGRFGIHVPRHHGDHGGGPPSWSHASPTGRAHGSPGSDGRGHPGGPPSTRPGNGHHDGDENSQGDDHQGSSDHEGDHDGNGHDSGGDHHHEGSGGDDQGSGGHDSGGGSGSSDGSGSGGSGSGGSGDSGSGSGSGGSGSGHGSGDHGSGGGSGGGDHSGGGSDGGSDSGSDD
ncbi:MAG TPA: hypothetical protein VGH10_01070 [Actinomycetota bacterium]